MTELTINGRLIRRGNRHMTDIGKVMTTYVQRVLLSGRAFPTQTEVEGLLKVGRSKAVAALDKMWETGALKRVLYTDGTVEAVPGDNFEAWADDMLAAGLLRSVAWLPGGSVLARWNDGAGDQASLIASIEGWSEAQALVFRQLARVSTWDTCESRVSQADLSALTGLPRSSVQYALERLIERGWLDKTEGGRQRVATYRVALTGEDREALLAARERDFHIEQATRLGAEIIDRELQLEYHAQAAQSVQMRRDPVQMRSESVQMRSESVHVNTLSQTTGLKDLKTLETVSGSTFNENGATA